MKIFPIPCLEDNYAYLIIDESSGEAAVVDPVEPEKVLKVANDNGVSTVKLVLTTHHHWLEHGDKISLGRDVNILALHTPCHTKGHICYFVTGKEEEDPAVFTGDTLFVAGCGKFFEGTAEQMYQSLCMILRPLPKQTRVYCDHEYTEKNLRFALFVEPENEHIKRKLLWAKHQREANQPTVPSSIEEELYINPFMRVDMPEVQKRVGRSSAVEALMELRRMKDNWTR
ncbi:hydroxyacylglutathione hydrolase cytoplasmic-like isoform X2 [Nymphaea colorata]|uniref:hydroxyacylglutathione hydrolase cytoplasmic-like isoform X2 n=1 Tax=Nymphaea colorata TaxID=210225 RepID=UPI00129D918C|nr:hydroxyacylglutathione hydrolase cytoplasmic-like isoform X2 [Nymphaea colorata]